MAIYQFSVNRNFKNMTEAQFLINPPKTGSFEIKVHKNGQVESVRSLWNLWDILEQDLQKGVDGSSILTNCIKQQKRHSLSSIINQTVIDGHAFCFGSYAVGAGQKFLKFDFFRSVVLEEFNIISGVVVDLTEFQQVSSQYYDVLNASKAYTWRLDLQTNEAAFAPSYLEHAIHGPGSLSITLNDWMSILHPDDVENAKNALRQLTSLEKRKVIVEYRRKDKFDNWIWLRVHAGISKYDYSGMPLEIKGISFNVTSEREDGV